MNLLECKNVSIGYNDKAICKDISFTIEKGEYVCIVGENGCGKSTLLKTILGLTKQVSGKIKFDNNFNKTQIGYLPQQSEMQRDFPAVVKEIVMSGFINKMGLRPFYNKSEKEKALKLMSQLNIIDHKNKSYKDLSGGQQQKVLLARALCATDELLVLDEPTNGLDMRSIKAFYDTIYRLNSENGITILMVTHNLDKVIDKVTKIIYLKNTQVFCGSKEEFLESEFGKSYSGSKE